MNRRQALIKKMAKRTKARENKKEKPNAGATKDRYISKAERAKLEAEAQAAEVKLADASSNETDIDVAAGTGN